MRPNALVVTLAAPLLVTGCMRQMSSTSIEPAGTKVSVRFVVPQGLEHVATWGAERTDQAQLVVDATYDGFADKRGDLNATMPQPDSHHVVLWGGRFNGNDVTRSASSLEPGSYMFAFFDPDEAKTWSNIYYDIIKSDACVPIGHRVNANIAMVSAFSLHKDRAEAVRRGQEGFEFFAYALQSLVAKDSTPGRSNLWETFQEQRGAKTEEIIDAFHSGAGGDYEHAAGIGTPADFIGHAKSFQESGVDQIILMQQAGRNPHQEICDSLQLFADAVLPEFVGDREERDRNKADELAPYIAAALARKKVMPPLEGDAIPVVYASAKKVQFNEG